MSKISWPSGEYHIQVMIVLSVWPLNRERWDGQGRGAGRYQWRGGAECVDLNVKLHTFLNSLISFIGQAPFGVDVDDVQATPH